ncbi:MAG: carbohydrate ABC transporter permease [Oscillospiraceae bacterium]|jgi:multiple sugar transport system permease protein|nr:carbohydrate ABC transporter permease [Oscillospiraceae bacterium]
MGNERQRIIRWLMGFVLSLFRLALIVGISYVILGPIIGIAFNSFFSNEDAYSPAIYLIPQSPTLERYSLMLTVTQYWKVLRNMLFYISSLSLIQIVVCSMVGYGFARFQFPLKKILFACVILVIVLPAHSVILPLYVTFRNFDPLGILSLITGGNPPNMLTTLFPMYMLTIFGVGLRSGLYIYIFNQFFRGLPKEIEEAAFVDGAGTFYTYLRVMVPNAMPPIITVLIFSLVWQYNDVFYANVFQISGDWALSKKLNTLGNTLSGSYRIIDPNISSLYVYAGIIMMILPMIIIYIFLQRRFIEGVERSGIVG